MPPGTSAGGRRGSSGCKPRAKGRHREGQPDDAGPGVRRRAPGPADPRRIPSRDAGMTTAEYALGTVAACGFAAVLWAVVHSGAVHHLIQSVVERALNLPF